MSIAQQFEKLSEAFDDEYDKAVSNRERLSERLAALLADEEEEDAAEIRRYITGELDAWEPMAPKRRQSAAADADRCERECQILRLRLGEAHERLGVVKAEERQAQESIEELRRQMDVVRDVVRQAEAERELHPVVGGSDRHGTGGPNRRGSTGSRSSRKSQDNSKMTRPPVHLRSSARVAALGVEAAAVAQARSPAFSARCRQCGAAATVATRVVVNDVVYHRRCLKCAACGVALSSDKVEFVDGTMFCRSHAMDALNDSVRHSRRRSRGSGANETTWQHRFETHNSASMRTACPACERDVRPYSKCLKCTRCHALVHTLCEADAPDCGGVAARSRAGLR